MNEQLKKELAGAIDRAVQNIGFEGDDIRTELIVIAKFRGFTPRGRKRSGENHHDAKPYHGADEMPCGMCSGQRAHVGYGNNHGYPCDPRSCGCEKHRRNSERRVTRWGKNCVELICKL
jgi:hypothetical protein